MSRAGSPVAFFLDRASFGPGSSLYFQSDGAALNPDSAVAVYELETAAGGVRMSEASARPYGDATPFYWQRLLLEQNNFYQPALLDAPDLWLWLAVPSPTTKSVPFSVDQLAAPAAQAHVRVWLQGASDFEADPDHHVRISINGAPLADASWDGEKPQTIEADVAPGILLEGSNELEVENLGDTAAAYSMVFLDKFELVYPRRPTAAAGILEGTPAQTGILSASGLGAGAILLDTTDAAPRLLTGAATTGSSLSFRAEAGRRYLAVDPSALLDPGSPLPRAEHAAQLPEPGRLPADRPAGFLAAAEPLLERRRDQGLLGSRRRLRGDLRTSSVTVSLPPRRSRASSPSPSSPGPRPSPRYVLLLGDSSYDPRNFTGTSRPSPLAGALDEDLLPLDRLGSRARRGERRRRAARPRDRTAAGDHRRRGRCLVQKLARVGGLRARASRGGSSSSPTIPTSAATSRPTSDDIAQSFLAARKPQCCCSVELGAQTRPAILDAINSRPEPAELRRPRRGGGLGERERLELLGRCDGLQAQSRQPLPLHTQLPERLLRRTGPTTRSRSRSLKVEGEVPSRPSRRAASASTARPPVPPALMAELTSGRTSGSATLPHGRQTAYAETGALPELLSIYHLFGDPAMRIR